jgi:predicted homoserine dehydrogenase-like protein
MSIARAIVQRRPTGELRGGPVAELVTLAKRDLSEGDELDGGGGYTVYGMSEQAEGARAENLLPFGVAYGGRVRRRVHRDQALTWDDVDVDRTTTFYTLHQEQARLFP